MQLKCFLGLVIRSLEDIAEKETKEEMCDAIRRLIPDLKEALKD